MCPESHQKARNTQVDRMFAMFSSVSVEESGINTRGKKAGQGQFEGILRLA
jgi:hypothetical protein